MENILRKLEKVNFISGVHDKLLAAEAIQFIEKAGLTSDSFLHQPLLSKKPKHVITYLDSFVKFNVMATGLFHYLKKFDGDDVDDLMINCNIDDQILLVAYKNEKDKRYVSKITFREMGLLPIHSTTIDLDYDNKIHILLYNKKLGFPEINLN